jgi:hypothetical protein
VMSAMKRDELLAAIKARVALDPQNPAIIYMELVAQDTDLPLYQARRFVGEFKANGKLPINEIKGDIFTVRK